MREAVKWAEFAMLAEGHRRAGMIDEAEQLIRSGLEAHPECVEGLLVMALVLLDQGRAEEARCAIMDWADAYLGVEVSDASVEDEDFGGDVSDGELDVAFAAAETDRDQVIDADAIARQAVSEVEAGLEDEFVSPNSSFATKTVADLFERQGDERRASQIRAMVDSSASRDSARTGSGNARKIDRLERWLSNIRGGMQ